MQYSEPFDKLIFQHEILRAKLEVRNHYLKTVVDDIYENTGQILSLIRVQLSIINHKLKCQSDYNIDDTGKLVAEVICNLRDMSKSLYPEAMLISESGLLNALGKEINLNQKDHAANKIKITGTPYDLPAGQGVIFFHVLFEIIGLIKQQKENMLTAAISYTNTRVKVSLCWVGNKLNINVKHTKLQHDWHISNNLSALQRIRLIKGKLQVKKDGHKHCISITIPKTAIPLLI